MRRFAVALLLLSGCATEPPAEAPPPPAAADEVPLAITEVPSFDLAGRGGHRGLGGPDMSDPDVRQQMREEMVTSARLQIDLSARLNDAPDWRSMEAIADDVLPQLPGYRRASAQRDVAERILRVLLATPALAPSDLDALSEYTHTVTRLQSTEGDDILRALIRLEGHWDPAMRAQVARTAARHLALAYTDQAQCVGCTVEEALANMLPQRRQSLDPLLYEIQTVHRELMRIARVGSGRS